MHRWLCALCLLLLSLGFFPRSQGQGVIPTATTPHAMARWVRPFSGPPQLIRPYITCSWPVLGTTFQATFDPMGCRTASGHYVFPFAYVLLSLVPPMDAPIPLPGGAQLWFDPRQGQVMVFPFRGDGAYSNGIVQRQQDARTVTLAAPLVPALGGMSAWFQVVCIEGNACTASGVLQVTAGKLR